MHLFELPGWPHHNPQDVLHTMASVRNLQDDDTSPRDTPLCQRLQHLGVQWACLSKGPDSSPPQALLKTILLFS